METTIRVKGLSESRLFCNVILIDSKALFSSHYDNGDLVVTFETKFKKVIGKAISKIWDKKKNKIR